MSISVNSMYKCHKLCNEIQNKTKYHTVRTISKSNGKIVEGESIDAPNTQIPDRLPSSLGTGTSIQSGGVKLVL